MIASSVASSIARSAAKSVVVGAGVLTAWQTLLADAALIVRLNGDGNADATEDALDYTGTYDGTWVSTPTYTTAAPATDGFAFDFAPTRYIDIASAAGNFTDNFSVVFWMKPTDFDARLATKRDGVQAAWDIFLAPATTSVSIWDGTTQHNSAADVVTLNAWNHVAFVFNGSSSKIFVNGVASIININGTPQGTTFSPTIYTNTQVVSLGYFKAFAAGSFTGLMSDFRIYNKVLSDTEITAIVSGP